MHINVMRLHPSRRWNAAWMLQLLVPLLAVAIAGVTALGLPLSGGAAIAVLIASCVGGWHMAQVLPEQAWYAVAWAVGGMAMAAVLAAAAASS